MTRSAHGRRARAVLAAGLGFAVLAGGGVGRAAPHETTKCATTICATAGLKIEVDCDRPDPRTVTCEGSITAWGVGQTSPVGLPGALDFRAEGRCGVDCSSNQLTSGTSMWNGATSQSSRIMRVLRFPRVTRQSTSRTCIFYSLFGASTATARAISPALVSVDSAEASRDTGVEVYACNTV